MVLLAPLLVRRPIPKDDTLASLLLAEAVVAPDRVAELFEEVPDDPKTNFDPLEDLKFVSLLRLAGFLGRPPAERWDWITRNHLYLWIVADQDAF